MTAAFSALRILSKILNFLPHGFTQGLGSAVGAVLFHVFRFRRAVVLENLEIAYGSELNAEERLTMAQANYAHYGKVVFEVIESVTWTPGDCLRKVRVEGMSNIDAVMRRGAGGIFLTSHLGNWELSVITAAARGVPLDVVVKQPRTKFGKQFLEWYRQRTGARTLAESGTARDILRSIQSQRFVAFVLDQFMGPPIGLPVKFFGKPAGTAAALALMTEKRDIAILPVRSFRDSEGNLCTVFEKELTMPPLSEERNERLFQKTQFFNDVLERHVRTTPEQWMWLHRRWKAYRGMPRWVPASLSTAVPLLLGLVLGACSSTGTHTPTGIELPSDPTISMPEFKSEESSSEVAEESESTSETAPEEKPVATETPSPEKKAKEKPAPAKKKEAAKSKVEKSKDDRVSLVRSERIPFEVGERMEIDLNWMALPAGRANLEVREGTPISGRPTFHLWANVLSSKLVDTIYHIDNTVESWVDRQALIPYKFLIHMVETQQLKETRVSFDHKNKQAIYWAKRISQRWGPEDIRDRHDTIQSQTQDMFSALYYARSLNYKMGVTQRFPVYENNQNLVVEATPVANELMNTKVGVFQCWKLKCVIKINNVLKPTGDIFLWLSDDSKKYIVKFDAKLKIGSLYGNLVGLRERK